MIGIALFCAFLGGLCFGYVLTRSARRDASTLRVGDVVRVDEGYYYARNRIMGIDQLYESDFQVHYQEIGRLPRLFPADPLYHGDTDDED